MGENSRLGMFFVHREKGLFLSLYMDGIKWAVKKNFNAMWKALTQKLILENQHLSLIMKTWDTLKDNVKKQRYCGQLQNHV